MQFGVSEAVKHWARFRPYFVAVRTHDRLISYHDLNEMVESVCTRMAAANFIPDRIAIATNSKVHFVVAMLASLRFGGSLVALNVELPDDALKATIEDIGVRQILHDSLYSRLTAWLPTSPTAHSLNLDHAASVQVAEEKHPIARKVQGPNDEWGVMFSSGTTGIPKGVERDHYSMTTEFIGWCLELNLGRDTAFYVGVPMFYTGGIVIVSSVLLNCGSVFLSDYRDHFNYDEVWADYQTALEKYKANWCFFEPDYVRAFVRIASRTRNAPLSAGTMLTMGARITGAEKQKAAAILGVRLVESWGNTESLGTITDPEDLSVRPDSVGRPFLTDELFVVDEDSQPVGPMQFGRVAGGEEAGFTGYCNHPEATSEVRRNALIISSDVGYTDEQGYLFVVGRRQDSFYYHGRIQYVTMLEDELRTRSFVAECCVVARQIDTTAVELTAVVVVTPASDMSDVQLLTQLNEFVPSDLHLSRVIRVNALPRVGSGKVDRTAVERLVDSATETNPKDERPDRRYVSSYMSLPRLRDAVALTAPYYGDTYVEAEIAAKWWNRNPRAFTQVVNERGLLCAGIGVLGLSDAFFDEFIEGVVSEGDLAEGHILPLTPSMKQSRLYISGVVVRDPATYVGGKRARVMVWTLLEYFRQVYGMRKPRTIYALAVSEKSARLMRRFGFQCVSKGDSRRDGHDLYAVELTQHYWKQTMKRFADCSRICVADFSSRRSGKTGEKQRAGPPMQLVGTRHDSRVGM